MHTPAIGATVRLRPHGHDMRPRDGIIVAPWGQRDGDWIVWFYFMGGGFPYWGTTLQGYIAKELRDRVTGTVADLPRDLLHRLEANLTALANYPEACREIHHARIAQEHGTCQTR